MVTTRDTRERLLAAAAELFAERGFNGTTARDIAQRGGVTLAAVNNHLGSKRDLYFEVLRRQFADIRAELERRGATLPAAKKLSRRRLEALLRARSQGILDVLLGPPPSLYGALMQRELCDPSTALPFIVDEFVRPSMQEMGLILAELAPDLSADELQLCVFSVIGQALFYRFAMPALLQMLALESYPKRFAAKLAEHVAEFSLGGLDRMTRRRRHGR